MATFSGIKSEKCGFLGMGITHVLILVLSLSGRIVIGYPECYSARGSAVNRRPKISFKALPHPFVLNQTNGILWCEGRSITENVNQPYPVIAEIIFKRNGNFMKSIFKDPRLSLTVFSYKISVTNIVPSDNFECIVLADAAPCNVAYLQYKILDARAPSFIHHPQESYDLNWLQFSCDTIGFPEPEPHWILNDTVIENKNNSEITIYTTTFNVFNGTFQVKSTIRIYNSKYPIRVQCSARNSLNHTFSRIVYAGYIQVEVTNITLNMVRVRWKIIFNSNARLSNIYGFEVYLTNVSSNEYHIGTQGNLSEAIFTNISINTAYACKVIGLLDNGNRLFSGLVHVKTLDQIPKPRSIKVLYKTSKTATIQWQQIAPNTGLYSDLFGYKVIVSYHSTQQILNTSSNVIILRNLSPQTTYNVAVRGYSKTEDGIISDEKRFITFAEIPKPPLVKVLKITPKTALVEWRRILPNKDLYGDLLGYKIVLDSQNQSLYFKKSIDTVQIPLEDLSPNTSYNFTIRGYTQNEDGLISDVKFFTTLDNTGEGSLSLALGLILAGGIILLIVICVVIYKFQNYRRKKIINAKTLEMRNINNPFDVNLRILYPERHNAGMTSTEEEMALSKWELPRERLTVLCKILGGGYFGIVKEGLYDRRSMVENEEDHTIQVAIKTLKSLNCTDEWEELLRELEILQHVNEKGHPNVVGLIGACTKTVPVLIVLEYCQGGNLKNLLLRSRIDGGMKPNYTNIHSNLTERQLIGFASDIANGMDFLHEEMVVHRDLASRNILLDEHLTPKIGDFGLARNIDINAHYIVKKNKMLPVKWLALESLEEGKFIPASDIWSYGILFWEICTLGEEPYLEISPYEILDYLKGGNRMEQPVHCSIEIFKLMENCWQADPEKRPKFKEIRQLLERMLEDNEVYVNVIKGSEISETESTVSSEDNDVIAQNSHTNSVVVSDDSSDSEVLDTYL